MTGQKKKLRKRKKTDLQRILKKRFKANKAEKGYCRANSYGQRSNAEDKYDKKTGSKSRICLQIRECMETAMKRCRNFKRL